MSPICRRTGPEDVPRIRELWLDHWNGDFVVVHGKIYRPEELEGFVVEQDDQWAGLIAYKFLDGECEIVSLDNLNEGQGIGSQLMRCVVEEAGRAGCERVFLITTNDNLEALGFYQRRGFVLVKVHRGAVNESRKIKPGISLIGMHGIPLRDEIELEMALK